MKYKLIIAVLIISNCLFGQENNDFQFKGFIDSYHAFQVKEPNNFLASRSRFRAEIQKLNGNSYFFTSLNAIYNTAFPELSKVQFREAFLEYSGKSWGIKVGRQIIIWGKADGMKITDIISPMDLTEFLAQDYDDIRMPVNGIIISNFKANRKFDLVCVPAFESYILPDSDNPWGFNFSELGMVEDDAVLPDFNLPNMEAGVKLAFYLSGIDIDIAALHTWNKSPVYSYYLDDELSQIHIKPEYKRLDFIGTGFSKSEGVLIIRGEAAFYFNKNFSPKIEYYDIGLSEHMSLNYLIGIDLYSGKEWTVTGQFSDEYIFKYSELIDSYKHTLISTLGISKKVFRSTLSLSSFAYFGLNDDDIFNRTSVDYALSDNIHLYFGFDLFRGNSGVFGRYKDNSQIWLKAKFCF